MSAPESKDRLELGISSEVGPRMEKVFLEASDAGRPVAVLQLGIDDLELAADFCGVGHEVVRAAVADLLGRRTRGLRSLAYGSGEAIVAFLDGSTLETAEEVARGVIAEARRLTLPGRERPVSVSLSVGLAENREDVALSFTTLVLVAEEGLTVARARGGECVVHTMLYDLLQSVADGCGEAAVARDADRARTFEPVAPLPPAEPSAEPAAPSADAGTLVPAPAPVVPEAEVERRARELADRMMAQVLEDTRRSYERRLEQAREELRASVDEDVDLLRRRVAKLTDSLERTEERLVQVAAMKQVDPGVPSVYRHVQGLDPQVQDYELRLALMRSLFDANRELFERAAS